MIEHKEGLTDTFDVVIVGGGPGGLAAALTLGRARKRVLLTDAGPRRNAAAERVHNFVTRDGTPPADFRAIGLEQLKTYPNVVVRADAVVSVSGSRGEFEVELGSERLRARRILLTTGMVDETLRIEGFAELWGTSIFQCPYCHGWEVQDRPWGYLVCPAHANRLEHFALQARGWTQQLTIFTDGKFEVADDLRAKLDQARIIVENRPIIRLMAREGRLSGVVVAHNSVVPVEVLFAHPPQTQVGLVGQLGLAVDENGFVKTDAMSRMTSVPGIYAAGDLASPLQGAIWAAAAGSHAAAQINVELTTELVLSGAI